MATTVERLGIVETKVENLSEKMDDLKIDVREMHDCLDKTRDTLKAQLSEMYDASCTQHAELAKKISSLEQEKQKWTWIIAGVIGAGGFIAGHAETLLKMVS